MSKKAIEHYEAALKEAFPSGATGDVFHHWNEARKALAEQTAPMIRGDIRDGLVDDEPAQQEPVAKDNSNYRLDPPGLDPRYTSPPAQRTWVGLSDADYQKKFNAMGDDEGQGLDKYWKEDFQEVGRWVEAKLKEKNT